jgi:hypothetical protein
MSGQAASEGSSPSRVARPLRHGRYVLEGDARVLPSWPNRCLPTTSVFAHWSVQFALSNVSNDLALPLSFSAVVTTCGSLHPFGLGISTGEVALSGPLQAGLRFFRDPLPSPPSPSLAVRIPPRGGASRAYPVAQRGVTTGAAASSGPAGIIATVAAAMVRRTCPLTFWFRLVSTFSLLVLTDPRCSLVFSLPISAKPHPDRCFQTAALCLEASHVRLPFRTLK